MSSYTYLDEDPDIDAAITRLELKAVAMRAALEELRAEVRALIVEVERDEAGL